MRTTLDIDDPILRELKALAQREGKSLGRLASELLARAMAGERGASHDGTSAAAHWIAAPMGARVDLADTEALHAAMDGPPPHGRNLRVAEEG